MCRDLELAVPGTYEPHKPVIHIRHVHASLNVITSKQRPRKLCITGECDPESSDNSPSLSYAGSPISQIETVMFARDSKTTAFSQTEAFLLFL